MKNPRQIFAALLLTFASVAGAQTGPGSALSFDGVNNQVSVTNYGNQIPTNEITVEFWQKVNGQVSQATFALASDVITNRFNAHVPWSDGKVYWDFGNQNTTGELNYTPPVSLVGSWQHFALVSSQSGNYMRIFRNGVQEAAKVGRTPFLRGAYDLKIGGNAFRFAGTLDEFRIWNTALSTNQIQTNMNRRLVGNEPGLVLYYRCDEGSGTSASDSSPSAISGVLQSSAMWVASTAPIGLPQLVTLPATGLATNVATLNATVNPSGQASAYYFQWGTTTNYGNTTAVTSAGNGTSPVAGNAAISGVATEVLYHCRVVATNNGGTGYGADQTFIRLLPGPVNALSLDGIDDFIFTPDLNAALAGRTMTAEIWFKANGAGVILDERGQLPTAPSQDWLDSQIEVLASGEVQVAVWHLPAVSLGTVTFGTWNHAVVRYNHATKTLDGFLNGVQSATSSTNATGRLLPADFTINALYYGIGLPDNVNPLGGGAAFSGQVDEFRLWSSARTPAEILANMNRKLSGTESNLLVYYRFNEGTSTIANDSSPNGNAGSLNNGPAWIASTAPVDLLTAVTQPATTVRDANATLNATVNPNASTTTVYFQYGLTTNYGSVTATLNAGNGSNNVPITNLLTGLAPLTTYHYRVIATNIAGNIGTGGDQVFTTLSAAGTALSFDGVNDFLLTANLRTNFPSETMTVELWFNANGAGVILDERGQRDLTGWDNSQMEILANGDVIVRVWNLTPVNIGNAAFGVWNHAALRYDKPGLKVDGFLNGVPSGFSSGDRQMPYEFNGTFGFYYAFGLASGASLGSGAQYNGLLDEIRIWNTARSASQIQTNRNRRLVGNESGLVAYYRLDEGSGLTAGDATTNGFTGTLSNGVAWVSSTIPIAPPGAVLTSPAQPVGQTFATLNGSLIPLGQTAAGYFQYGLTTAYGSTSAAAGAGNGTNAAPVSVFVSGLTAATTYHYRLVATNNSGTTLGQDLTFTTTQPGPGTAVSFDGVDDRVLVANFCATAPTTEITIELWQKVFALAEQATFTVNSPSVNNLINAHIPYSDGAVYWDFGDFAGGGRLSYTPPQSIVGTWQHFALVASQSGNFMRIYRNGVLEAQKAGMTPFTQGNFNLYIGGNGLPFAGVIDEFRVWNTARTGPQIQANFGHQLTGTESNLVLYFRFDEGTGTSVGDASGHGLTGQLQNGTAWVTSGAAIDLPLAISLAATNVSATNATFTGTVNPNGIATTAYYEWGTTTGYGSFSGTNSAGSGTNAAPLPATINGLTPGATYHYRLVATNNIGVGYGVDQSFVTPVPGPGTALNLDGISDYIITPNLVSAFSNETVTIELWFNATAAGVLLDERGQADTAPSQDWLDSQIEVLASGQVKVTVYNLTPVSVGTVSFGTWNHVVLRYDKVAQRLDGLLNGVPSAGFTTGERFSPFEAGYDLYYAIGRGDLVNPIATGAFFTGKVDEFRVWTSARSTAQILSNMNHRLTGTESNLLVYYRFDEGSGTVAFDATTNHLDGAARNNVPWTGSAAVVGLPVATTTAATLVTATTARLNGTVDPDSVSSSGFFHWGTTTNYGNSTGLTNVGGGTSLVAISNTLSGLTPGTTYHFRAVASNSVGLHLDGDQTFTTTLDPPTVTTLAATNITSTNSTVNGSVNPNGLATTYSFQYGPTTSYGSTSSVVSAGSGSVPVTVSNNLAGLTPGVLYHFRVVAGNGAGTNAGGDLTFTTDVAVPVATTLAASGVASSSATLNGTVTANGATTTAYFDWGPTTNYSSQAGLQSFAANTNNAAHNVALSNLSPATTYHFRLVATNNVGTNAGLDQAFTTPAAAPTVTTLAASSVTSSNALLNGTVNPNGAATTAYFEYGLTTSYGNATIALTNLNGLSVLSVSNLLAGLLPGTTYHFRAVATNNIGTNVGGDQAYTTPALAPTVTTLAASSVTASSAMLNGTVNPNGATSGAYFEYGATLSYGSVASVPGSLTGTSGIAVSNLLASLSPGVTYHFRLAATNSVGTNFGGDQFFTALAAAPTVTTLAASSVTSSNALLNGTVNPNGAATTAYFEYGFTTNYGSTTIAITNLSGLADLSVSNLLAGLLPGATYHYRLVATNNLGTNVGGDQAFTTPALAPAVTTLAASSVTASSAMLNGTANPNGATSGAYFEYGATLSYGSVASVPGSLTGTSGIAVSNLLASLSPGVTYHFRLAATNSVGTNFGGDQFFTALAAAPTVTTLAASSVTSSNALLNGTVNPNGAATTAYFEYGFTTNYGSTTIAITNLTTLANLSVSNLLASLLPGTTYHYRVVATNNLGTGSGGDQAFITPTRAPDVVALAASGVTSGSATMNGTVNPNGAAATAYFEYGYTTSYGGLANLPGAMAGTSVIAVSNVLAGLPPGVTYHYRLTATNSAGTNSSGDRTFTTSGGLPVITTLPASGLDYHSATVNGTVNANGYTATAYFEYGLTTGYGTTVALPFFFAGNGSVEVSHPLIGLAPGATYHFRLAGTNSAGPGFGGDQTFTLPAPPVPPGIDALLRLGDGNFKLQFHGATGLTYTVLGSATLTNWTALGSSTTVAPGQFEFTDPNATNQPVRFYKLSWP